MVSALFVTFGVYELASILSAEWGRYQLGWDFHIYMDRTRDFVAGHGFYLPAQLTGQPYELGGGASTYPPVLLYLLVPMLVLPEIVWWITPLSIIAYALYRLRPAWWSWPVLALVLVYPRTWALVTYGNPALWAIAFSAAGMVWAWPSALCVLKPTLAPLALFGARHRSWWMTVGIGLVACLPFGLLWRDYIIALVNAHTALLGADYLFGEWPIALVPLVAWAASERSARGRRESGSP